MAVKKVWRFMNVPKHSAWFFMAPALLVLFLFTGIPLIASFVMSLSNLTVFMNEFSITGLGNFVKAFQDARVFNGIKNTLVFTVFSVPLQIGFALLTAAMLSKNTKFFQLLRGIYFVPALCSFTAISVLFIMLLDRTSGLLPYYFKCIGIKNPAMLTEKHSAMAWIIIISLWRNFGTSMVILISGIHAIPRTLYEAAAVDGASTAQQFFKITIPQLTSGIGFCVITETIGCLQLFDQSYVLTKGGPMFGTESIVQYIYTVAFQNFDLGYASSIAVILFVLIIVITTIINSYVTRKEKENY